MLKKYLHFLLVIFLYAGFASTVHSQVAQSSPGPSLESLIYDFLLESNRENSKQLQTAILSHPEADVEKVAVLIQQERVYEPQPVGSQPGRMVLVRGNPYRYGLYVPTSYDPSKAYPLVVCLHGAGFTGDAYLARWEVRLGEEYILACPTQPYGAWWTRFAEELVLATIHEVQAFYRVDPDRIYLTGMSNGGIGAWIIGMHHANSFAGVAPMASGIDSVLYPFLENLGNTPLYILHGSNDQIMPVKLSRDIAQELDGFGVGYTYREHDRTHPHAGGHFFPREELPALVSWFSHQHRKGLPKKLTVVRDATHLTSFSWIRIDATDQIAAFSENLIDQRDEFLKGRVFARLEAEIIGPNEIHVKTTKVRRYTLFFNHELVDFTKPVAIHTNGNLSYQGMLSPQLKTLLREARRRQDHSFLFLSQLTLDVSP
jgi:pimeloyl-ACP methyl ester carboxylesterase